MTLEERKRNFTSSQENLLESPNPIKHSFNRNSPTISDENKTSLRTPSPEIMKSTSQPVSPEPNNITDLECLISESLPPTIFLVK